MKTFKEIYRQIISQQTNNGNNSLPIVQRRRQQKAKIRDDEKAIEYEENGTKENKEKYVASHTTLPRLKSRVQIPSPAPRIKYSIKF